MISVESFLDSDRRQFGERVTEALRWFFLVTVAILNNVGILGVAGAQSLANWTLAGWTAENLAVTLVLLRRRQVGRWFPLLTTGFDICAGVALVYETDGYSSPYLLGLFVTIIAASVRFGTFASLASAAAISILYLTAGAVAPLSGSGVQVMGADLVGRLVLFAVVAVVTGLSSGALVKQRRVALEEAAESESLFEMASAMASSLNVKEVFDILLEQAKAITKAESGMLLRVSRGGVLVAASDGSTPSFDAGLLLQAAAGGEAAQVDEGRVLLVPIPSSDGNGFVVQLTRAGGFCPRDSFRAEKLASVGRVAIANAFSYGARTEEASRDVLTGALNRREFERRLAEELSRFARGGSPLSVMLIDVDHFKAVNDTFGHARGDEVLTAIVQLAGRVTRVHDVVGRLGGDEFAILLPDTGPAAARQVAERLADAVREAAMAAGHDGRVTLSIGLATCPPDGCESAALLASADEALYEVKRRGRDGIASPSDSARGRGQLRPLLAEAR